MPAFQTLNGANSVAANGSDFSVQQAQTGLQESMNRATVMQAQMMEKQTVNQLNQTQINNNLSMVNSTKEMTDKVRL